MPRRLTFELRVLLDKIITLLKHLPCRRLEHVLERLRVREFGIRRRGGSVLQMLDVLLEVFDVLVHHSILVVVFGRHDGMQSCSSLQDVVANRVS